MRVDVSPPRFRWARERAGMSLADLSHRFPGVVAWEEGTRQPTLKQLEAFAKATYAPVGFFFLASPPVEAVPIPDFRTVRDSGVTRPSPNLLDTLYTCQQRQDWYREFARTEGDEPLEFVGSLKTSDNIEIAAAAIREGLGFDVARRAAMPTWTDALRRFIEHADEAGVLVMVSGVVGNNTRRKLDPEEFRGFALADPYAPLVFVNGADSKAAQMFTLAHELAHLWLGATALSDVSPRTQPLNEIERWCNRVAAELLVPMVALREQYRPGSAADEAQRLARYFKVSTLVILRRLRDLGALTGDAYWNAYHAELTRLLARPTSGGGDFYLTQGARLSKRFARALIVSALEGRSTFTEAFRLLGVGKVETFYELGHSLGVG